MKFKDNLTKNYKKLLLKKYYVGLALILILILSFFIAIKVGAMDLSWNEIINALINRNSDDSYIVWNLRVIHIVMAIVVGFCMGIEGCIMQSVLRNPLATPYTMGITQGSGFGVAFLTVILSSGSWLVGSNFSIVNSFYITSLFAFTGAILSVCIILILSKIKSITPTSIILAGMAISSLFSAGTMLLQYFADPNQLSTIVFWTFGNVERVVWNQFWMVLIVFLCAITYFIYHDWDYNALETGEETAKGLGINTDKLRLKSLIVSSFTAAICTSCVGVIGFIGLIAPHIIKRIVGVNHTFLIPYSALLGAIILIFADIISRIILKPEIVPIGIITAFLGVPIFIYVLIRNDMER